MLAAMLGLSDTVCPPTSQHSNGVTCVDFVHLCLFLWCTPPAFGEPVFEELRFLIWRVPISDQRQLPPWDAVWTLA